MKSLRTSQQEWAQWKYFVMARSQKDYLQLRKLFANNDWNQEKEQVFAATIEKVKKMSPTIKAKRNAYEHVWGYFKKQATTRERELFREKLEKLGASDDEVLAYLRKLSIKYQIQYLLDSKLLFEDE